MTAAPLVDGDRLISLVGGEPDGKVMALDKRTGAEIWRGFSSDGARLQPADHHHRRRDTAAIIWHPRAVSSLDPATGRIYWEVPYSVDLGMTVSTAVQHGSYLLVSSIHNSGRMIVATRRRGVAAVEGRQRGISALITTPVIEGDYIYGMSGATCLLGRQDGRPLLALARADQGAHDVLHRLHRPARRPLLHQHRAGRTRHRAPVAGRLRRSEPIASD
jgi:outer membrane protein assembly factor BamB